MTMIVTCPSCDAQYILPDEAVGPRGRRVKCTSCDYTWLQYPESVDHPEAETEQQNGDAHVMTDETEQTPAPPVIIDDDLLDAARHRGSSAGTAARRVLVDGVVYGLCALIFTLVLALSFSDKIVRFWPESARFYALVGADVPPPGHGLRLEEIRIATTATDDKQGEIALVGKIVNHSDDFVRLPLLRVRASGADGWLKDWIIDLENRVLAKGKEATLDYLLQDAPAGTRDVTILFVE